MKKLFIALAGGLFCFITVSLMQVHAHHQPPPPPAPDITVNVDTGTDVTEVTNLYSIDDDTVAELVAKAAACDHSFYWGKPGKWQVSPQGAYYDGEMELCIGAAYRPQDTDVMFNLSIVPDEDSDQILFQGGALFILD